MIKVQGETVSLYIYFRDENNQLFDPDSVEASVYKPDGSQAEALSVNKVSVGKYSVVYTFAEDAEVGEWFILVKAVKGSYVEKEKIPITVQEGW